MIATKVYHEMGLQRTTSCKIVEMYHGSTARPIQEAILKKFKENTVLRLVISTIAFGMGINVPDVRLVSLYVKLRVIYGSVALDI